MDFNIILENIETHKRFIYNVFKNGASLLAEKNKNYNRKSL